MLCREVSYHQSACAGDDPSSSFRRVHGLTPRRPDCKRFAIQDAAVVENHEIEEPNEIGLHACLLGLSAIKNTMPIANQKAALVQLRV
jgi:hypothetical protein